MFAGTAAGRVDAPEVSHGIRETNVVLSQLLQAVSLACLFLRAFSCTSIAPAANVFVLFHPQGLHGID